MTPERIPAHLKELARAAGYSLEYRKMTRYRGWPRESAKPFGLYHGDGAHIASFATLAALERSLRGRAGC